MPSVQLSEEVLSIVKQEATLAGMEPEAMIEYALRDVRLRRELKKGADSIAAGRVSPLDIDALKKRVQKRMSHPGHFVEE